MVLLPSIDCGPVYHNLMCFRNENGCPGTIKHRTALDRRLCLPAALPFGPPFGGDEAIGQTLLNHVGRAHIVSYRPAGEAPGSGF
jgi:hypothetical protein